MAEFQAATYVTLAGLFLTVRAIPGFRRALASRTWPQTDAVVTRADSYVNAVVRPRFLGTAALDRFEYDYILEAEDGRFRRHGRRIRFGAVSYREAGRVIRTHPVGAWIRVVLNPTDSSDVALYPGPSLTGYVVAGASVAVLLAGLIWLARAMVEHLAA
jgi:hypothetical protein